MKRGYRIKTEFFCLLININLIFGMPIWLKGHQMHFDRVAGKENF